MRACVVPARELLPVRVCVHVRVRVPVRMPLPTPVRVPVPMPVPERPTALKKGTGRPTILSPDPHCN